MIVRYDGFHLPQIVVVLLKNNRRVGRIQPGRGRVEDHLACIASQRQEEQGERALHPAFNEEGGAVQGEGGKVVAACLRERLWNRRVCVYSRGKVVSERCQIAGTILH